MKSIMKTILRNTKLVMILAFLPALFSAAQVQAVDYKGTYKGVRYEQPYQHAKYKVASTASAPTMGFQSTSALPTSGSAYTANPMIEGNGLVATPSASAPGRIGHIRRTDLKNNGIEDDEEEGEETCNGGTPGQTVDPEKQLPLGDVVWPLMMLLCAYAGYKKVRARKEGLSQ